MFKTKNIWFMINDGTCVMYGCLWQSYDLRVGLWVGSYDDLWVVSWADGSNDGADDTELPEYQKCIDGWSNCWRFDGWFASW